ncbi:uncharacterized protein EV420DRAFT_1488499 [Desarmillaria tabescens]|uniref:Uncharacterized protein n=1 Tax=Armillaria tabescens TaxID=1929756 RepID=A0AA39MI74_ARMTA|nr:uncharacterized protein EV420DRAFT_1488499 [Desarmillaria tabescens]KAK0434763.1 hypothetical protein EV420DRAFT_1488499 [Desarmillaria tabescens]
MPRFYKCLTVWQDSISLMRAGWKATFNDEGFSSAAVLRAGDLGAVVMLRMCRSSKVSLMLMSITMRASTFSTLPAWSVVPIRATGANRSDHATTLGPPRAPIYVCNTPDYPDRSLPGNMQVGEYSLVSQIDRVLGSHQRDQKLERVRASLKATDVPQGILDPRNEDLGGVPAKIAACSTMVGVQASEGSMSGDEEWRERELSSDSQGCSRVGGVHTDDEDGGWCEDDLHAMVVLILEGSSLRARSSAVRVTGRMVGVKMDECIPIQDARFRFTFCIEFQPGEQRASWGPLCGLVPASNNPDHIGGSWEPWRVADMEDLEKVVSGGGEPVGGGLVGVAHVVLEIGFITGIRFSLSVTCAGTGGGRGVLPGVVISHTATHKAHPIKLQHQPHHYWPYPFVPSYTTYKGDESSSRKYAPVRISHVLAGLEALGMVI